MTMINRILRRMSIFCLIVVASCMTVKSEFKDQAINVNIRSSQDLNLYEGKSHTIKLCVYQLKDPNGFNQLKDTKLGVSKLLECIKFDNTVTNAKSIIIYPGKTTKERITRYEGSMYVGVAAGYYRGLTENMTHFFKIPVNFFTRKTRNYNIGLYLGSQEIQVLKGD
jgi:type VI secretion system VasD/TssJ family lipoprotein